MTAEGTEEGQRHDDRREPQSPSTDGPVRTGAELPVQIRPAVAAVLVVGGLLAVGSLVFDPPPEVRYGLVGLMGALYFLTKLRHWL